jgi:hypothetical protein
MLDLMFGRRQQSFVGTLANGRFQMVRLVRGKNSFRPTIDGELSPAMNGCRVDVRLKLSAVALFACVLLVVTGVAMTLIALPRARSRRMTSSRGTLQSSVH